MSRTINDWLDEYGTSHQNSTNKLIHWFAVPGIYWSILALLWTIPTPAFLVELPWLNWSTLALVIIVGFYVRLSMPLTLGMVAITVLCYLIAYGMESALGTIGLLVSAVTVFVVLWVFQFVGHHIEGKRPSFFKDIQFLMIGPAWVMAFLFRKMGWKY